MIRATALWSEQLGEIMKSVAAQGLRSKTTWCFWTQL